MDHKRDADMILAGIKGLERTGGRLRVFIGMCPGVGKTFAMLSAAREIKARGVDVVIGIVETHGRLETEALLEGIEILPLKTIVYRDTELKEFDIDGAIKRKPAVILVDELAHTNVPGSRHPKRHQDVEELLSNGIDVLTTVNIQHIESRADLVEKVTGTVIRERVPDSVLDRADPIELIDLSPEQLLRRLDEGKVYQGERATRAANGFFKEEHLIALRELSLRFVADLVDDRLIRTMSSRGIPGPWNTGEKLLVAISHSPYSTRLIRACRRLAAALGAPWIALHVNTGETISAEDERQLRKNLALAHELGAELLSTTDFDIANGIQRVASNQNVTQIVMGRPDRRIFRDLLLRGTLLARLVNEKSDIDVHVIRQVRQPKIVGFGVWLGKIQEARRRFGSGPLAYWQTLWLMLGVGFLSFGATELIGYRAVGYIFLLAVLLVASVASLGPILFAAAVGALSWNFFFIPPRFTFQILSSEDWFLTLVFFVVAVVGGSLSNRIRRQREDILVRESRTAALYEMTKVLSTVHAESDMAAGALDVISRTFSLDGIIVGSEPNHGTKILAGRHGLLTAKTKALADWVFANSKEAGSGTDTLSAAGAYAAPIVSSTGILAVLVVPSKPEGLEAEILLEGLLKQLALAMDRARLSDTGEKMRLMEASERLYQTVLNSVSHELKTPLTTLIGAAGVLVSNQTVDAKPELQSLVDDMNDAARRMKRVVENPLDVSRLSHENGYAQIDRQLLDWNDHVTQSVALMKRDLRHHHLEIKLTEEPVLVRIDEKLMEHAISNLIANSINYAPRGTTVVIETGIEKSADQTSTQNFATLSISDQGPGITAEHRERIFEKFYRVPGSPPGGTGLGLALVRQILEEHGGTIDLDPDYSTGARFKIRIPINGAEK
ncbi:MAG: sensor histidine kinase KdpD [Bdellovibrionales bacterium]|nr:sensor histidine kinase KdpD [Bdellovibrionales bacterium]